MRVLHLSDVHVDVPVTRMPASAWLSPKRWLGGANLELRRRPHFRRAREKLLALERFREAQGVDLVICTGDYTALGTAPELDAARAAIEPLTHAPAGFVTVPGNHDVYVADAVGAFEARFGEFLRSDLPELRTDGLWPIVRLIGEDVAVVAVNSARPNPQPWRSSGRIPDAQIDGLRVALADPRVRDRFVFVITHYAPRLADGRPDRFSHGLANAEDFLRACGGLERGAILHGHVHRCYTVRVPEVTVGLYGAGSTTQDEREGLWLFDVAAGTAARGRWRDGGYELSGEPVTL